MKVKPSVTVWLDARREKKDGRFPVKIEITYLRKQYYYPTGVNLNKKEFEYVLSNKPGIKLKDARIKLFELERQANATIDKITDELQADFNISLFEKYLHIGATDFKGVFQCYERKIAQLKERNQLKTAIGYETSMNAFQKFHESKQLSFAEIDKNFLENFEAFMLKKKKSLTTVGIYVRCLRTIFNEAIQDNLISTDLYPFGHNKYQVPQSANNKRALDEKDLLKIFNYKAEENSWEEYAKDMWVLSLACQGMNMKDIANLRYKNIQDDKIVFIREKTKRTKKTDQTPIIVYIGKEVNEIIKKWGNENSSPTIFVFPIYSDENTPLKNLRNVEQQIKMINKYIRKIAGSLSITQDITFYAARHSFATSLKRQGRSVGEIQEFLGHSNIRTTERYLASFGDQHKRSIIQGFMKELEQPILE